MSIALQRAPTDGYGRDIHYLRLSLTDHCNLRCVYCMPLEGLSYAPPEDLLTATELELVVRAAAAVGFTKVRLTGGEPALREDVVDIVHRVAGVAGITDVSMTTNGVLLAKRVGGGDASLARRLFEAGLSRVNVHLDTLDADHLARVMRRGRLSDILAGIEAAESAGLRPIKINAVVVRDYNDLDVVDLARLTFDHQWHVRFIELMPFGTGDCAQVARGGYVSNVETRSRIEDALGPMTPLPQSHVGEESVNFRPKGARGVVGFISPVSAPYCGSCNRMRLTADGKFHLCLLNDDEVDVRSAIRSGGGQAEVERLLKRAVRLKPMGHQLDTGVTTELRIMHQIGG